MMMDILKTGGVQLLTDNLRKADDNNPRGYHEFEKVKKLPAGEISWLQDAVGKAVKIISPLLIFLPDKFQYRVIFMKRGLNEIISSQNKMLEGSDQDLSAGDERLKDIFNRNTAAAINFMDQKSNFSYTLCNFKKIVLSPCHEIKNLGAFLGCLENTEEMVKIIDPILYHQRE